MKKRIDTIIFDFGNVLLTWDPHRVYDPWFGSREKADWFLQNICTLAWNGEIDAGKSIAAGTEELCAKHPGWEREIRLYFERWIEMIGPEVDGMYELVTELKAAGYRTLGLTNWSLETFCKVSDHRIFALMDGFVISGAEHCLKPEPEIFRILLDRYGLRPEQCVFIDDSPVNAKGAEAVGITGICFKGASALRQELERVLQDVKGSD